MPPTLKWNRDRTVTLEPAPKRVRKCTGTKFASVLGLNRWATPFQTWCEATGAFRVPFEDTPATLAGKVIEPKQIAYMKDAYMFNLVDPTDIYGRDYFQKTWGNFFDHPVLGGMWDALERDPDTGEVTAVFEFKTTKRAEDWADDVPEYYALQAALYAYLLGCDEVVMVCSFVEESDYDAPEEYVPSVENTVVRPFYLSERYPTFEADYVRPVLEWWRDHVEKGVSPTYDEKLDKEYLDGLRTLHPDADGEDGVDGLLEELSSLMAEIDAADAAVAAKKKRAEAIKKELKAYAAERVGDAGEARFGGHGIECVYKVTKGTKVDEEALEADGLLEKYSRETETARFTVRAAG